MRVVRLLIAAVTGFGIAAVMMQGLASATSPDGAPTVTPEKAIVAAQPVLTATVYPGKDNTLFESADGSLSSGAGAWLFVGRTNQPEYPVRRGILAFTVAPTIPAGSTVLTVTFRMTLSRVPPIPVPEAVGLHRATADWGEGTSSGIGSGAPATPGDATWFHRFYSSTVWSTSGGDFVVTPSVTTTVGAVGVYTWTTTPALVADVQGWVNASQSNFGWVLKGDELTSYTARGFYSREAALPDRPILIVEYTPPPYSVCLPLVIR